METETNQQVSITKDLVGYDVPISVTYSDEDPQRSRFTFKEKPSKEVFFQVLSDQLLAIQEGFLLRYPQTTSEDIAQEKERIGYWVEDYGEDILNDRQWVTAYNELRVYMTRNKESYDFDIYDNSGEERPRYSIR